jgi:hypothetical protein
VYSSRCKGSKKQQALHDNIVKRLLILYLGVTQRILFNAWKHHLGFLRSSISQLQPAALREQLLITGNAVMDIYTGALSYEAICQEVEEHLLHNGVNSPQTYMHFIGGAQQYRSIVLSDGAVWVLRLGNDPLLYVHIHPGRYSMHSLRVKAASLKTAIALRVSGAEVADTAAINRVRQQ